jgi:hypothetical protein
VTEEALDGAGFEGPAMLPAGLEAFAYPAPLVLDPGRPGADIVLTLELYLYQLPGS